MNEPLFKRLITKFQRMKHPEHLNMKDWVKETDCGWAMCIGGHAMILSGYKVRPNYFVSPSGEVVYHIFEEVRKLLDIGYLDAEAICYNYKLKTPAQAAKYLQQYVQSVNNAS